MADGSEDDITIIDGESDANSINRNEPLFNYNLSVLPNSAPAFSNFQTEANDASHHALSYAYSDLKKRFNELESKNRTLTKSLKKVQASRQSKDMANTNGSLNFEDYIFNRTNFGNVLVARDTQTDSVGDTDTHLLSDAEQAAIWREELRKERLAKQDLSRTVEEWKVKYDKDVSRNGEEIRRLTDKLTDLENETRDIRDENACLKRKLKESEDNFKKVTLAKLQADEQLIQNDEYNELLLSQMQRRASVDFSTDQQTKLPANGSRLNQREPSSETDTLVDEELRKAVDVTKRLVLEMGTMQTQISKQKEQIQIVSEHVEKKKLSKPATPGVYHRARSDGTRSKVPVETPDRDEAQVVQCEEDLMTMQPDSPNQTMVVTSPRRKLSQGCVNIGNPFDFSCSPLRSSPPPSNQVPNNPAFQHILRKKEPGRKAPDTLPSNFTSPLEPQAVRDVRREPKRSHSAVLSGNSIFDTNEDIYNESLPSSPRGKGGRAFTAPPLYRHSLGQTIFGNEEVTETAPRGGLPSPEEWTNQAMLINNRPEPIGRCDTGENRHRPVVHSSQPRPINIDRNVDDDTVMQGQASADRVNVNLFTGSDMDKSASAQRPELLNNDPLATGQKTIPSRNIFKERDLGFNAPCEKTVISNGEMSLCPICSQQFLISDIQEHVSDCLPEEGSVRQPPGGRENESGDKVCPMCSETFPGMVSQTDFEAHVNRHFGDEILENFEVLNP